MKRKLMAMILMLAMGIQGSMVFANPVVSEKDTLPMTDGSYSEWARAEIVQAIEKGLVTSNSLSKMDENITREGFAELVMNMFYNMGGEMSMDLDKGPFTDVLNNFVTDANKHGNA